LRGTDIDRKKRAVTVWEKEIDPASPRKKGTFARRFFPKGRGRRLEVILLEKNPLRTNQGEKKAHARLSRKKEVGLSCWGESSKSLEEKRKKKTFKVVPFPKKEVCPRS